MNTEWEDWGPAPAEFDPLTSRGEVRTETYPIADGAAFPEGWSVSEWLVDFEKTPFYDQYEDHVSKEMELTMVLSDWNAMRGTGKTTLSIKLARCFDRTDEGLTPDKVTNSAEEFIDAYVREEKGSGLVFDEAEGDISAREAMSNVNKEMNKKVSIGRVGEKYAVWNMPDLSQIDKEVRKLAHFWVLVRRRGRARVYKLSNDPFENDTYTKPICEIEWTDLPSKDPIYDVLDEQKWDTLEGQGQEYVPYEEYQHDVEQAHEEGRREARDEFVSSAYERGLLNQPELAEITDLTQSQISRITPSKSEVEQ